MDLEHTRQQLPIGQGFFHSGELAIGEATFRYVYDCGSENKGPLEKVIRTYASDLSDRGLDVLFISHLDADHVNGLDRLLVLVKTKQAILPYLSPTARLILIAKALEQNTLTGSYLSMLCDPTAWFTDRGVDQVIYVTPSEPPGEGPPDWTVPPGPTFPPHPLRLVEKTVPLPLKLEDVQNSRLVVPPTLTRPRNSLLVSCFQPFRIVSEAGMLNWQFVTFVHPEGEREDAFRKAVRWTFGKRLASDKRFEIPQPALLKILQVEAERDKLAACYVMIRKNRNLTSLSLYSGPITLQDVRIDYSESFYPLFDDRKVAWLGTGDSNLKAKNRRAAFVTHFAALRYMISTLALPHHGSKHNYHSELASFGWRVVVSAGLDNRHGHPHDEVTDDFLEGQIKRVTEIPKSRFVERVTLFPAP